MGDDSAVDGQASTSVTDEQLLAELQGLTETKPPAVEPAEEVEAKSDEAEEPADENAETEADEEEVDEETDKRLAPVRKYEQRVRAEIARERAEIEKLRAVHAEDVKLVREFSDLKKRRDIVGVAKLLGYKDSDFEDLSLAFYADSEKGKADPKYKAKVEQTAKERALQDRLDEMQKRLDERDQAEKKAREEAEQQKQVTAFVDNIAKAATAKAAPRVVSALKEFGEDARDDLLRMAGKLYRQTGTEPTAAQVVKAYEAYLARAAKLGGSNAGVGDVGKKTPTVETKKPATPGVRVSDDELARELASGNLS